MITYRFLLNEAIVNVPAYILSSSAFLSIKLAEFIVRKANLIVDISCSHPFYKVFPLKYLTGGDILFIKLELYCALASKTKIDT